jgi:hypothetical protein
MEKIALVAIMPKLMTTRLSRAAWTEAACEEKARSSIVEKLCM